MNLDHFLRIEKHMLCARYYLKLNFGIPPSRNFIGSKMVENQNFATKQY